MEKIILKPTDYNAGKTNPYSFNDLKDDVTALNDLQPKELAKECNARWNEFSKFPIPSNYRRYKAGADLAKAKGVDISFGETVSSQKHGLDNKKEENQPGM